MARHVDDAQFASRAALLRRLASEHRFALLGVAPAEPSAHADFFRQWLGAGRQGGMAYLAEHVDQRLDPRVLLPGAHAVICVADRHHAEIPSASAPRPLGDAAPPLPDPAAPPLGRIARYAWGDDYHRVLKKRLHALADALRERFPDEQFLTTVDTAPIHEREHAQRAGLGWVGKHTLLIHPRLGSWMLLGEIVTTLRLQTAADLGGATPDHCGGCTRCIDACPTQCIDPAGYGIDASRCVSYLTLEHRGAIDPALHAGMGDWLAGCDVCQEVCPFNREPAAEPAPLERHAPRPPAPALPLLTVLGWSAEDRRRAFTASALKRMRLDMLKRNALIAAGNALRLRDDPALRRRVADLAADPAEPDLVRMTARQALGT